MFNKIKSLKLSDYIELKKEEYVILKLTPTKSNKNNSTDNIASLINKMFISVDRIIQKEDNKLIIQTNLKASYYIHITKYKVQFYFIVPKIHLAKFRVKFSETWKNIEMNIVDYLPIDLNDCSKYQMQYVHNDTLSLNVDKRNNDLLNANMSSISILEDDDIVGVFYNFIPTGNRENNYFKKTYKDNIVKYEEGNSLKNSKNIIELVSLALKFLINLTDDFIRDIQKTKRKGDLFITNTREVSSSTKRKFDRDLCKTQTIIISKSKDTKKEKDLGISLCNSFKSISEDNELSFKEIKTPIQIDRPLIPNVKVNRTSTEECQNFISLPGRELIEQYRIIDHKPILDNPIPQCLQTGNMFIGLVNYKEQVYKAFFSTHQEFQNLERVLIGSKGSGKSYKMMKMAQNAIELGRGAVIIDIIEDCKLSQSIAKTTPNEKLLRIRCSKQDEIQAFSYNEIPIHENMTDYEIFNNAVKRTQQLQVLLDAVNDDKTKLTSRMIKFLFAAGSVVYSSKHNASLSDVLGCLEYHEVRNNYIESLSPKLRELLSKRIAKLKELDEIDSKGNVKGNKDGKVEGILDRIAMLDSMSAHLELALNKISDNNVNFVDALRDNKVVLIEIPEQEFPSQLLRNIMATFYLSKIWLAKQQLAAEGHQPTTELFFDEFYKCPNCQTLFEFIFAEARKFRLISTVAIHNLGQLNSRCRLTLKSGGASYMLLAGADLQAYRELHSQFEKFGYDEQSFLELKTYHALCLIKNEDENYSAFVAKLPA